MSNIESNYDLDIYRLYKDEIKREDEIIHQRNMSSLTFQGFLFAAMTFLLSNPWFKDVMVPVYSLRVQVLALLGFAGFFIALITASGIRAAASSIVAVSKIYEKSEARKDPLWPQLHGRGPRFKLGGLHAVALHYVLAALWAVYEVLLIGSVKLLSPELEFIVEVALAIVFTSSLIGVTWYLKRPDDGGKN